MLKTIGKRVLQFFLILTYIAFLVGTIAFGVLYGLTLRNYNDLNNTYSQAQDKLNSDSSQSSSQIENLQQAFKDQESEIESLKSENESLKTQLDKGAQAGYGQILGKISGQVIISEGNVSQYQQVCAQNTANGNLQYCLNVSAVSQEFTLVLPAGTYHIVAHALDKDGKPTLPTYTGFYTEYVKCVAEKKAQCDTALSKNVINLEVKSGSKLTNVNPVDWKNT